MISAYWAIGFIFAAFILGLVIGFCICAVMDKPECDEDEYDPEVDDFDKYGEEL